MHILWKKNCSKYMSIMLVFLNIPKIDLQILSVDNNILFVNNFEVTDWHG